MSKLGLAVPHRVVAGDVRMGIKKKSYSLRFVRVEDRSDEIIKTLAKNEMKKVLERHGAVSYNLDEVLSKYITGEMCSNEKE